MVKDAINAERHNQELILDANVSRRINAIADSIPDWALHYNYILKKIPTTTTNYKIESIN